MSLLTIALRDEKINKILCNSFLAVALLWGPVASADPVDGVADTVIGQPNFTTADENNGNPAQVTVAYLTLPT